MTSMLSPELKVACEIWHYNVLDEPIWFGKLVTSMVKHVDKIIVSHALDTLEDWVIIYGEHGETEKGHAGRIWYVDTHDEGDFWTRDLYEKYWKVERDNK
jgi:hypothetical protein